MLEALVDDRGKIWPVDPTVLFDDRGRGPIGRDAVAEAICARGFIYLESVTDAVIVAFRPRFVTQQTMAGAFFEICRRRPRQLLLTFPPYWREPERFDAIEPAIERIAYLVRQAQESLPREIVRLKRLPLEAARRVDDGAVATLLGVWSEADGRWSTEFYHRLVCCGLLDNAVVVRNPPQSDALLIEHWGKRRDLLGRKWIRDAPGRPIQDQPHSDLGRWATGLYHRAIADREPRLDHVEVAMHTRRAPGKNTRYSRLLLPWRAEGGERFALTVNVFEPLRAFEVRVSDLP